MPRQKRNVTGGIMLRATPLSEIWARVDAMWERDLQKALAELAALDPEGGILWYNEDVLTTGKPVNERLRMVLDEILRLKLYDAMEELKRLDPDGWEAWYDDNDNVPEFATDKEFTEIINARLDVLIEEWVNDNPNGGTHE